MFLPDLRLSDTWRVVYEPGSVVLRVTTSGDFNEDGSFDCADIDALVAAIASGSSGPEFDLTGDQLLDGDDLAQWLADAGAVNLVSGNAYLGGDANLDGNVDGLDFLLWNEHKFTSTAAWCSGDFNADGIVNGLDFLTWNGNKFTSSNAAAVPEPAAGFLILLPFIGLFARLKCHHNGGALSTC